jgi:glutamine synthetase
MSALTDHQERNSVVPEQIREAINSGVEHIYYQFNTLSGKLMAKVVPAAQLVRNLENGMVMHRSAVADYQISVNDELIGGGPAASEFQALPDIDTFAVLPWDPTCARFLCSIYEPEHRAVVGGSPFTGDARGHLRRTHAEFRSRTGLELRTGCEPEMTWLGEGMDVTSRPGQNPSYEFEQLERMKPIYRQIMRYCTALGMTMIECDYEDVGQLEVNWMYDNADLTADRVMTYRMVCRQVAREFGVTATFMPKVSADTMGTGLHHNLSLWRDGMNTFAEPGRTDLHLTDTGRHALGGILTHAQESMLILATTANSYKRFCVGQFAPTVINWALEDKTAMIRLSGNGRLEYKLPDSAVNPYLSHALLIAQIQDGLDHRIDPDAVTTQTIPTTLGEAIKTFTDGKFVRESLPQEISDILVAMRTDEWRRYCANVTQWERDTYLTVGL